MSISSPLPSTTYSNRPLPLTFSLEHLPAPQLESIPASSSTSSRSITTISGFEDVFDELDESVLVPGGVHPAVERSARGRERLLQHDEALTTRAGRLFPYSAPSIEVDILRDLGGRSGRHGRGGVPQPPNWFQDSSAKVTSMAIGDIDIRLHNPEQSDGNGPNQRESKTRRTRRVAVGSEDGVVWIFRDSRDGLEDASRSNRNRDATLRPVMLPPPVAKPHRPYSNASRPSSPPGSSSPCCPPSTSIPSPRLPTRRSSASVSTLSSFASQPATRHSSGCRPPSLNGSTATTYSEVRSPPEQQRLRKASATVSVSTTSMTPSPGPHRHTDSRDSLDRSERRNEPASVALPSMSPVEQLSTAVIPPLSPIPTRAPLFKFSSSDEGESVQNRTTPSPPASRRTTPHSARLSSRKENSQRIDDLSGKGGGFRSQPRVLRESVTSGIGLWEGNSRLEDVNTMETTGLGIAHDGQTEETDRGLAEDTEDWTTGGLEPVLKILTPGRGPVVGIETVSEHRIPYASHRTSLGAVLVVLRQSGHLSIISMHEGRCLGSCQTGQEAKGDHGSLRVVEREYGTFALCVVDNEIESLICVDLETLSVVQSIAGVDHFAVSPSRTSLSVLFCAPGSKEIFLRAIPTTSSACESETGVNSLGTIESWSTLRGLRSNEDLVVAWDATGLSISVLQEDTISQVALIPLSKIQDVALTHDQRFIVTTSESLRVYGLDSSNDLREVKLKLHHDLIGVEQCCLVPSTDPARNLQILMSKSDGSGKRSLDHVYVDPSVRTHKVYTSPNLSDKVQVTVSHRLDCELTILGFSNGAISLTPNSSIGKESAIPSVNAHLDGSITVLDVIDLGGRDVVVAGNVGGTIGCWDLANWEEIALFSLFASPVLSYAHLSLPSHEHTLLFVSCNSPVALVSLHPPRLLYTLPGSKTPAKLVASTKQGEVMVLYREGLARVWDAETGELRRSTDAITARGVLQEKAKGWRIWFDVEEENAALVSASKTHPSITFELRTMLEDVAQDLPWSNSKQPTPKKRLNGFDSLDPTPDVSRAASPAPFSPSVKPSSPSYDQIGIVRRWLSSLVPFGVDTDCDEALEQLGVVESSVHLALATHQAGSLSYHALSPPKSLWTISSHSTAHRLLLITCLLRIFLNYPSTERFASDAIVHFTSGLAESVGADFQRPSLAFFAGYWLDKNPEVQQAAKTLLGTYLAALSDFEIVELTQEWEQHLPLRQASRGSHHSKADVAVLLVGLVAVDRFKLLSASVLANVSISVASYLEESQHPFHQALATELCSRGFHIWQNYVDAMALVRQLFSVAIGRNASTPSDLRAMARQATVHVAGVNPPLFMSTLLFDILNAPTAVSRNATLKLLGFMIRKKPLVLYHSLPRVVEAVVKSLDPTVSDLRETVHQTATVILNELVRTFPSIDFQGRSQRLAVGTQEGSAIVYDLKTATRLYVLEGHRRPLTAVSWSADGHRLATVCLDESKVCVWKTGMGILSLIGAPTQRAGSPPFKEWDFHVGDEALMTTAATLEWIIVDWPGDRTVRLRIRETALSFGA